MSEQSQKRFYDGMSVAMAYSMTSNAVLNAQRELESAAAGFDRIASLPDVGASERLDAEMARDSCRIAAQDAERRGLAAYEQARKLFDQK